MRLGVQLTGDVAPWETAKLRLLNGAHSALAYLGKLAGYRFVHEAIGEPLLARLIERLWDESQATMVPPNGLDLGFYRAMLMRRFADPALPHALRQIAADGSRKLPPRLLEPIQARANSGEPFDALALAVSAWIVSLVRTVQVGRVIDDPRAEEILDILTHRVGMFPTLLEMRRVLPADPAFDEAVDRWTQQLSERGVRYCLSRVCE